MEKFIPLFRDSDGVRPGDAGPSVLALQEALNVLGFDCGHPDGIYGSKTEMAIKKYQQSKFVTGWVSPYLIKVIQNDIDTFEIRDEIKKVTEKELSPTKHISPNFSSRKGFQIDTIVIHYTASVSQAATHRTFMSNNSKVSAHFNVDISGKVDQYVELENAAWHAGGSVLPDGDQNANSRSIGIEIENWGYLIEQNGKLYHSSIQNLKNPSETQKKIYEYDVKKFGPIFRDDKNRPWASYTKEQFDSVVKIVKFILDSFKIKYIVGHSDINKYKSDPGPSFPMKDLLKAVGR